MPLQHIAGYVRKNYWLLCCLLNGFHNSLIGCHGLILHGRCLDLCYIMCDKLHRS